MSTNYPRREGESTKEYRARLVELARLMDMFGGDDDYDDGMGNPVRDRFNELAYGGQPAELNYDEEALIQENSTLEDVLRDLRQGIDEDNERNLDEYYRRNGY